MTGDGVRAAADAAQNGSREDYYAYFKVAGSNRIGRPLQPVPAETIGAPGQSGHSEAEMDRMVNGVRTLQLGESQGTKVEYFFLRQLGQFKGDNMLFIIAL